MLKRKMNRKKGQQGFTLLEILVVVAIMGFLVAMVAPRFAGITDGTIDVVCDTNQQRMISALSAYSEQKGRLPGGMVNLVDESDDGAAYFRPTHTGELEYPDEGQATFFEEFFDRNLFQVHILDEDEAKELRAMGIGSVYNLNAYNYEGTIGSHTNAYAADDPVAEGDRESTLRRVGVSEGLGVLMVGMGAEDVDADLTGPGVVTTAGVLNSDYDEWGNPDWLGRIMLGIGPDSDLIKEGMISAAGLCPGGINKDDVHWNNYNVLLPRLEATVARYDDDMMTYLFAKANGGSYREFDLKEAQAGYMFITQCPEGHRFATAEEFEEWAIYAAADDTEAARTAAEEALEEFFED
ncbi:type II secretion system protein [Desulfonatronum thiodismutans]|uniref:type II secretion system protein n=1 Tax=Desulfonatronum thiodismutans TaxID=159290 RepID=UPI00068EDE4F|nr:type II secretion system protein [Desulfonatronum thiodismutans]